MTSMAVYRGKPPVHGVRQHTHPWSDIVGPFVTPEDFGAVGDGVTEDTAAIAEAVGTAGRTVMFTGSKTYLTKRVDLASNVRLYGNGATIKSGYTSYATTNYILYADNVSDVTISGFRFEDTAATLYYASKGASDAPFSDRFIYFAASTQDAGIDPWVKRNRRCVVSGNKFFGGGSAIIAYYLEDCSFTNNVIEWPYEWGIIVGGHCGRTIIAQNQIRHVGITEGIRISSNRYTGGSTFSDAMSSTIIDANIVEYCGALLSGSGFTGTNGQHCIDIFCYSNEALTVSNNIVRNGGGGTMEAKWNDPGDDLAAPFYRNVSISNNTYVNNWANYGLISRYNETTSASPGLVRWSIDGNRAFQEPFTRSFSGASVTFDFTSGSKEVEVTITDHGGGQRGGWFILTGLNAARHAEVAAVCDVHEILEPRYIDDVTDDTFTFDMETAATATDSIVMTNATLWAHWPAKTLGADPIAVTNGSTTLTFTKVNHGLSTASYVLIEGATTGGGISAISLNRWFKVASAPSADTFTVTCIEAATSTTNIGGSAVTCKTEYARESGYWLGHMRDLNFARNQCWGGKYGVVMQTDVSGTAYVPTTGDSIYGFVFVENLFNGCDYGTYNVDFQLVAPMIVGNKFMNCIGYGYRTEANTSQDGGFIADNTVVMDHQTQLSGMHLTGLTNVMVTGNRITSFGYGITFTDGLGTAAGNRIAGNVINCNVHPTKGLDAFHVNDSGGGTYDFGQNEVNVQTSRRGIIISAGTANAGWQIRGTSAAIPTIAGAVGDIFIDQTPAAGATKWICTVAGNTGAATWVAD